MDKFSPPLWPISASHSLFLFLVFGLRGLGLWLVRWGRLVCGLRESGQKLFIFISMDILFECTPGTSSVHVVPKKARREHWLPEDWTRVIEGYEPTHGFWDSNLELEPVHFPTKPPLQPWFWHQCWWHLQISLKSFLTSHSSCFGSFTNDFWSLSLILCGDLNDNWFP